jgi:hypothetical protein
VFLSCDFIPALGAIVFDLFPVLGAIVPFIAISIPPPPGRGIRAVAPFAGFDNYRAAKFFGMRIHR